MLLEEVVHAGRDNDVAFNLTSSNPTTINVTRAQVLIGSTLFDSNVTPAFFDISIANHVKLKLGQAGLSAGRHQATLYIYDASHPNGLYWDEFIIVVK